MSKPNLAHIIKSVLAAFVGVQSDKNREIDFQHGSLASYVAAGIIATLLFIALIVTIVGSVL